MWLATQNHSTLVTERSAVPFLPVNPEYSATRNQVKRGGQEAFLVSLLGPLPFLSLKPTLLGPPLGSDWLWDLGNGMKLFFSTGGYCSLLPGVPLGALCLCWPGTATLLSSLMTL